MTNRTFWILFTVCLFGVNLADIAAADPANYRVKVPRALDHLEVEACFEKALPDTLISVSTRASGLLARVRASNGARIARRNDLILIGGASGAGCLEYRVDLKAVPQRGHWRREFVKTTDAVLVSPDLFLWLPEGVVDVELQFELPRGFNISAPWVRRGVEEQFHRFRTGGRDADWGSKIALGRFETRHMLVDGASIDIALLTGTPAADNGKTMRWLRKNIAAVAAIYGRFPVPKLQILVAPIGVGNEPVPWGQVSRGGGEAVHLYINQKFSESAFLDDWVLSHELSHLFHPFLWGDARWIYEGLASYYQNVTRSRTAMKDTRDAWESLHSGFERGIRGGKLGRTLRTAAKEMLAERTFMQVYWSGAAIFLLADLELRQASANEVSLDSVLNEFRKCCLPSERIWTAKEFLRELDRLSDTGIFTRLAAAYLDSDRFPDLTSAYQALGLVKKSSTELEFENHPEQLAMRAAIMGVR